MENIPVFSVIGLVIVWVNVVIGMTDLPDLKYPCGCRIAFKDGTVNIYYTCDLHKSMIEENKK